ncbi:class I SAM-dependent methyltransferase [Pollutimonas harenae]|uniref:Class I SAM-dependent methyltransferase n=1 Tax=Pollutimonas harenae TaxID=657015 RepID=A0A853GRX9_9BURK|nr:class I SAM-dependent methyltransferase [Pollutimonas harenae]NYT84917.1 class I SAM-dependent methyltransferase [Pollutimonas harenae]TEA72688.1 class I SAM-dependent methyltransferase [Pollutimonas harenae]
MTTPQAEDLKAVSATTLEHYRQSAESFRMGTMDHDVSQNIDAFLGTIQGNAPYRVLDFGCGPGRDLLTFTNLGHIAVGLDGTDAFVTMARAHSGCEVWLQDFFELNLPDASFDGVFANASLFHVPSLILPKVLQQLHATLKPGGVLFSSNPRGQNQEGWNAGRYGVYHDIDAWRAVVTAAGFSELDHYYRPPGLPRAQQTWLASVWRKSD